MKFKSCLLALTVFVWANPVLAGFDQGVLTFDAVAEEWRYQDTTQSFGVSGGCAYDPSGVTLANVSSSTADVGFSRKKDKLGNKDSGQNCGDTSEGQVLSIELGSAFTAEDLIKTAAISAVLKGNAVVEAYVYENASDVIAANETDPYILRSGFSVECSNGVPNNPDPLPNEEYAFPCISDSNPDADKLFTWSFPARPQDSTYSYRRVEFRVINGDFGIQSADFNIIQRDGVLTCVSDGGFSTGDDFTIPEPFLEVFVNGNNAEIAGTKVQCKRIENRDGSPCAPVDYTIEATCEGEVCTTTFLHDDQPGVARSDLAFICEAWWPEKPANFTPGEPLVAKTKQFFGPNDTPGDDLDFCPGVTPVFSDGCAPTSSDQFQLSDQSLLTNGGSVTPACASTNLLSSYDDVILNSTISNRDQCDSADSLSCPDGVQLGCLLDERNFVVEDSESVNSGDPEAIITNVKQFQRWLLQGDYSFSKSFTGTGR